MSTPIRVFRVNTGSCGGCDAQIVMMVHHAPTLTMVEIPNDADIWLLTGIMTPFAHTTLGQLYALMPVKPLIIAMGQCAINGAPFGAGGIENAPELPVVRTLAGCPPSMAAMLECIEASLFA